jgi:hypothetical protein
LAGSTVNIKLNPSGTLALTDGVTTLTTTAALTDTSHWYRVEVDLSSTTWIISVDGTVATSGPSFSTNNMPCRFGADDTVAATYTAYIDDIAFNDAALPGAGQAVLLLPVSDNSRGTWTGGAGGTTNTFDAINNRPPVGVAIASATNTSQIKTLATAFPANYDVNMTDYTTAGIGASDTINGVLVFGSSGEDPATGTKAGGISVVSNPAIAETTFNFGNDLGAAGTFPGNNWITMRAAISNAPSVTRETQPVVRVRVTSGTTAARAAMMCSVGMYVDYTPAQTYVPRSPGIDSGFGHT